MADSRGRNKGNPLGIPPRWLRCPRKAVDIIAGKFLPFKTPLSSAYDDQVPEANRFLPIMLLASLSSYKVKMGLWIDLTNTDRFYNYKDIEAQGIKYLKLQCRGHKECPSEEQTQTFIRICSNFISKNPLEIIGVHCTHGFNRTGFLIVAYLVENLAWSVEAAVAEFAKARPPGIYKADYLRELFTRYGDPSDTPAPPPLPEWCDETVDGVDDDGNPIETNFAGADAPKRKHREFNKKNPTFMEGVSGVIPVSTQPKLRQIQQRCQDLCDWNSSGFPGAQPVSMDNNNIILLQKKPYKVSWKADGTRYMMLIDGENEIYFIDRDNCVFQVQGLKFPRRKDPKSHLTSTLLDGEMIIDKVPDGGNVPRYLAYDIIRFEGIHVGGTDFDRRRLCIQKEIIQPRRCAHLEGRLDRSREPFSVRCKDFWDITAAEALLGEKFNQNLTHEVDGLIFQPVDDPYKGGQCPEILKWKPPSLNSVDFKLMIRKEERPGMLRETKGYLYVGGLDTPFAEIKVTKELRDMDKKIIECKYENGQWKFMRERTDKSFPNSHSTAVAVCNSIINPITKERLLYFIENHRYLPPARPRPPQRHFPDGSDRDLMPPPSKIPHT